MNDKDSPPVQPSAVVSREGWPVKDVPVDWINGNPVPNILSSEKELSDTLEGWERSGWSHSHIARDIGVYLGRLINALQLPQPVAPVQGGDVEEISELEIKKIIQGMLARFVDIDVGIAIKKYVIAHLTTTQSAPSVPKDGV